MSRKLLFALAVMGISFTVFLIAPGNYMRDGLFPERDVLYSFYITAKSFAKFGAFYLPARLHHILLFAFPFVVAGYAVRSSGSSFIWSFKELFWRSAICFGSILLIFFYLTAFVMVETGPPRVWFLLSFLLAIYCSLLCFYAGMKLSLQDLGIKLIMYITSYGGIIFLCWTIYHQYPKASAYSAACDERISYVTSLNKTIEKDTLILLEPLPPPGMLYSAEIAADTNHFTNRELRLGYDLKYHVAVKR
jgi:hypothetical protein